MDPCKLSQSLRDAADNSIAKADLEIITASRYVKKTLLEITDLFPDDCTKEVKRNIVEYLLHSAAKKVGDDTKSFNLIPSISDVKDLTYLYTSSHDISDLTTTDEWQSLYGSVVWTKHSKSDPWWPSYVCDPRLLYPGTADDIRDLSAVNLGKKHLVYYYGEATKYKYGFATLSNIRDYFEYRAECETQSQETKSKTLQRALPLADSEAIRDASLRIAWVQYLHEMNIEVERLRKKIKSSSSKKKGTENLISESLDSLDSYSAALKKDSLQFTQKKRNIETVVIDSYGKNELSVEIPARKKANVLKISDSHDNDRGTSGKQRENDDGMGKRKSRLTSNKQASSSSVIHEIDSPTEVFSDSEGPTDHVTKSPLMKKPKTDYSDEDAEDDAVQYVDLISKKLPKKKPAVKADDSAKHAAKVSKNSKSLYSTSVEDDEEGSDSAGAAVSKTRARPMKASELAIPDDDEEEEEVESPESEDAEEEEEEYDEEEISEPKKKGKASKPTRTPTLEDVAKSKKKPATRVVIDLAVTESFDDDSDLSARMANRRSSVTVSVQSGIGKGKAPPARSHSKTTTVPPEVPKPPKDAAKGSKGRNLKSLSTDSGDVPLRRSSRATVIYEENASDEKKGEEEEEEGESVEAPGEVELVERKLGRPRGSDYAVQKPVRKRGRPPSKATGGLQVNKDNRHRNRKGRKDNGESDTDNDESEEGDKRADDDEKSKDENVVLKVEEHAVGEIIEEVATVDLKKPLNETSSERLGRLLRILASNTKESAVKLVEKAIITMDKIENLVLTMDELKESGAAERISLLRKHSNPAIAAKAKQLRAKWMEAARRSVILAASSSSSSAEPATVDGSVQQSSTHLEVPPASDGQREISSAPHSSASSNMGITNALLSASDLYPFDDSVEPSVQQEYKNGMTSLCYSIVEYLNFDLFDIFSCLTITIFSHHRPHYLLMLQSCCLKRSRAV
jgi:PWWP domain/TFIIS helical bundle-like domain